MKLDIFLLLILATSVFSRSHHRLKQGKKNHHQKNRHSDPFLSLLKRKYSSKYISEEISLDAGEPLYLSEYIAEEKYEEARKAALVDNTHLLEGLESYAGYITVNSEYNSNLWFWYFPVQGKPVETTPWIIWLQGGPGATSLFGAFEELGPMEITKDLNVEERKYSWAKNYSMLFIDNPVGAGFSFTEDERGYSTDQYEIGENLYFAVQQFLLMFPELRTAPLTIAGESYAGKHIPSLAIQIHNTKSEHAPINLQKLAIGNGWVDPLSLQRYSFFAREIGLLDDAVADELRKVEISVENLLKEGDMKQALENYGEILRTLIINSFVVNPYNILTDENTHNYYANFMAKKDIRKALHVGNSTFTNINIEAYRKLNDDLMSSAKKWLEVLLNNYDVMMYSGHLDLVVPYHASVNTYLSLDFDGAAEYRNASRIPWTHNKVLAGYYKSAGKLLEVMVRGAGHMVAIDKPSPALGLISAFVEGISLSDDTGYLVP